MKTYMLAAVALLLPLCGQARAQDFIFLAESRPLLVRVHVEMNGKSLQAAWDDLVAHLFRYADVNKDGTLSQAELDRTPTVAQIRSGGPSNIFGRGLAVPTGPYSVKDMDTNNDGKIDLAEFSAYLRKSGLAPFQLESEREQDFDVELFMGLGRTPPPNQAVSNAMFAHLDANHDGNITKEELAAAPALLRRLDTNEDEVLTAREIAPNARALSAMTSLSFLTGRGFDRMLKEAGDGKIVLIPQLGQAPPELASRLYEAYYYRKVKQRETQLGEWIDWGLRSIGLGAEEIPAVPAAPSPDGNAVIRVTQFGYYSSSTVGPAGHKAVDPAKIFLSRADLGLDEATFAALDLNRDGKLNAAELAGFVRRTPDVELVLRLGNRKGGEDRVQLIAAKGQTSSLVGKIKMRPHLAMIDLGSTRAEIRGKEGGYEMDRVDDISRQQFLTLFKQADREGNGYLVDDEKNVPGDLRGAFKVMDRDGDGKVTEQEFVACLDLLADLKKRTQQACVSLLLTDESRGLFDLIDVDRDGKLSLRELRGAAQLFDSLHRADKNHIARTDLPRSYKLTIRRGLSGYDDALFSELTLIYGGQVKEEEDAPSAGPAWFRKMDRNRDGDISRSEWLGSEELFRRIDTDGDGLISPEEAQRYDAERRRPK